jgi:transcriptional regulator with XRE-family HTH domain
LESELRRRDMRQADLARRLHTSTGTVSDWINNKRLPSPTSVERISDVLVLDYDLVATKAGYRPAIHEVPPDSREARAAHLVTRIDWETQAAGFTLTLLEQLALEVPKRGEAEGE